MISPQNEVRKIVLLQLDAYTVKTGFAQADRVIRPRLNVCVGVIPATGHGGL